MTKNALFEYFRARILKNYCLIWNQHPQIRQIGKFRKKTKLPKFGTKNVLFRYFWAILLKNYCLIWNQHPQVCQIGKFCKKEKLPKFVTKNALFGYFWNRTLKNYCHIWYQHPEICLIVKFVWKKKSLNLGPKSPIGYFWRWMSYLGIFEISTLKFVYMQNFSKKQKCLKFGPKMPYLVIFGLEF